MLLKNKNTQKKGFTLIEMIVVIGLIAVVSALVLFNSGKLNSAILVSNTAYEIGLIVRESQVAGLGVTANNNSSNQFISSHGVHINRSINPKQALLFSDINGNKLYDSGEETQIYTFQNNKSGSIFAICKKESLTSTNPYCVSTHPEVLSSIDIIFTRPNPEAFFKIPNTAVPGSYIPYDNGAVVINIGFENNICRSVVVEKTGAVEVKNNYCPPIL